MEDQELIKQLAQMFHQQAEVMADYVDKRVAEAERRIAFQIETDISKRIEALFDGYMLTHEKQQEQQQLMNDMQIDIENNQLRIIAPESKGA